MIYTKGSNHLKPKMIVQSLKAANFINQETKLLNTEKSNRSASLMIGSFLLMKDLHPRNYSHLLIIVHYITWLFKDTVIFVVNGKLTKKQKVQTSLSIINETSSWNIWHLGYVRNLGCMLESRNSKENVRVNLNPLLLKVDENLRERDLWEEKHTNSPIVPREFGCKSEGNRLFHSFFQGNRNLDF